MFLFGSFIAFYTAKYTHMGVINYHLGKQICHNVTKPVILVQIKFDISIHTVTGAIHTLYYRVKETL